MLIEKYLRSLFAFFPCRLNVALSRAIGLLIVIGNPMLLKMDENWKQFIQFVNEKGFIWFSFQTVSVFFSPGSEKPFYTVVTQNAVKLSIKNSKRYKCYLNNISEYKTLELSTIDVTTNFEVPRIKNLSCTELPSF